MQPNQEDAKREVEAAIYAFFEAGKNKDLTTLEQFHYDGDIFTKFDEFPPYTRQDLKQAVVYEQAAFANMSDYQYNIQSLRVDLIPPIAIATFYLDYKGVFVNNYSFEGSALGSRSRVSMVLLKSGEHWKIIHEHFSTFPDWPKPAQKLGP